MARRRLISDDFNRADAATLGSNWTTSGTGLPDVKIVSNAAMGSTTGDNADRWIGAGWTNQVDHYVEGIISLFVEAVGSALLLFRMNTTNTYYAAQMTFNSSFYGHALLKFINGSSTLLSTISTQTTPSAFWAAGDTLRWTVQSSTIKSTRNDGTAVTNLTDTAIDGVAVGGTNVGIFLDNNTWAWDSWAAGDFQGQGNRITVGSGMSVTSQPGIFV